MEVFYNHIKPYLFGGKYVTFLALKIVIIFGKILLIPKGATGSLAVSSKRVKGASGTLRNNE